MNFAKAVLAAAIPALSLAACGEPAPGGAQQAQAPAALPAPNVNPAPLAVPPVVQASANPLAQTIDKAVYAATPASPDQKRAILIRAQVLLDRANFSPGVIDGQDGGNIKNAVQAFEAANGLPEDGRLDEQVWALLVRDGGPVMTDYVISPDDVDGPFVERIPEEYRDMAKLERLAYTSPLELLAEKFHMDPALLQALNPNVNFGQAGSRILVTAPGPERLPAPVALVQVDKTRNQVRAYAQDGKLLASFPATVGSQAMPTPDGVWAVNSVTPDPVWNYDPSKLNFGDKSAGKLTIKPGPNNPVGAVWIDLTKDTYGIHGAPDPKLVGKTASHGCVRLTNWDARKLGSSVQKGVKVEFMGGGAAPAAQSKT